MFKENLLEGKRILVTGGGTGLGKEMSRYFLKFGAEVLIWGRRLGVLEETAKELMDENGGTIKCYGLDIRGPQDVDETIEKIFSEGPLSYYFKFSKYPRYARILSKWIQSIWKRW